MRLRHASSEFPSDLLHLNQGTLYPALVRLEQQGRIKGTWGKTESNREAKYYAITKVRRKIVRRGDAQVAADVRAGGKIAHRRSLAYAPVFRQN